MNGLPHPIRLLAFVAALAPLAGGCASVAPAPSTFDLGDARVEHYRLNRCGDESARPCHRDADCDGSICVSVLPSDAGAFGRDGGHTVAVGEAVLWQFGDSFTEDGLLSSTAAWSDDEDPLTLRDAVSAAAVPVAFLAFTANEERFNRDHATPPACCRQRIGCTSGERYCNCPADTDCRQRIALWPGDGIESEPGMATVYYDRQIAGVAPYDFVDAGVGVATIGPGDATARRLLDESGEPLLVFAAGEPHFARGLRIATPDGDFFYAYANRNRMGCAVDVVLTRVPVAHMADRSHYRFWSGAGWSPVLEDAQPVARAIVGGLGSVSWNARLGGYLSVWSDICTGGDKLALRWAPEPQGPWSDAVLVDLAPFGATPDAYYGMVHPEFGNGSELVVTYFQPIGVVDGQIRLLRLILP